MQLCMVYCREPAGTMDGRGYAGKSYSTLVAKLSMLITVVV